nr:SD05406p [Drosophila melanogaster]
MQSDFHRMKNFANPKSMFKTSAPSTEQGRPEPPTSAAAPAEAKDVKPKEDPQETGEPAGNTATTTAPAGDDAVRTEHLYKHPLMNVWTLWYLENDRSKSWEDMQTRSPASIPSRTSGAYTTTSSPHQRSSWVVTTRYSRRTFVPCGRMQPTNRAVVG